MRRKFFLIVFVFLLASILIVSTAQLFFFESERLLSVDQRLETIASSLIASGLSLNMIESLESTDNLISDLLGEERVDHIINVYSLKGKVLAQNYTASEIALHFSPHIIHETYEVNGQVVRVLNIKKGQLVVQVGALLGPSLLSRWIIINPRFAVFTLSVFLLLIVAAYFSSGILFRPLRRLTQELRSMSSQLERKLGQPLSEFVIGSELLSLSQGRVNSRDEFERLCLEIETFLKKLADYTRAFHAQTAILTHELKTPLTILRTYLEELQNTRDLVRTEELGSSALNEIDRLSKMINDYLQWSVLTSNPGRPEEIYAVKLSEVAKTVVARLNAIHDQRIQLEVSSEALLFAMRDHVQQLLSNLLSNALYYSPTDKPVICRIFEDRFVVEDQGPGIPSSVQANLGSPFNRGEGKNPEHQSSGLGLAWVYSLCEKYHWRLEIHSNSEGTRVAVWVPGSETGTQ